MALKQIKNKITATQKTGKVTKAMEAVSAVKMRKSQENAFQSRPYVHTAMKILARLADSEDMKKHTLSLKRDSQAQLVLLVTSDKGLAGSVNSAVIKQAEELLQQSKEVDFICVGRKALEFATRQKKTILANYTNLSDDVTLADVYEMSALVLDSYKKSNYVKVHIIYQNFISTFEQAPTKRQVLPLDPAEIGFILSGIKPKVGKWSDREDNIDNTIIYTIEPSAEEVIDKLIPQLVQIMIYHSLLESKASEHSARMVAMKNATDKSKEVVKSLTIKYNKARQAKITAEISEITAGVEAMKGT